MSLKTDLPYEIDCNTQVINLGQAAGTSWSLEPVFFTFPFERTKFLDGLKIKRVDSRGALTIDVTLRNSSGCYDRQFTESVKDGQTSTIIKLKRIVYFPDNYSKVTGIVTVRKYEEIVNFIPNLSSDLIRLLNNPDFFPDAILKCGETEISVHKCILSVRSSVFAAMFKNEMQESITGNVKIEDLEPNVLNAMLKYIYSDSTDNLTDVMAGDLLFAADKYQLKELKLICVDKLKSSLTVNNVSSVLLLGHLHDFGLKDHAKDFVCKCKVFSELENTEDWNSLKRNHPDLAIEVLTSVVKYKENIMLEFISKLKNVL